MVELDLEVAAEFLYVEALLVQIKSQLVLPRTPAADGDGRPPTRARSSSPGCLQYRKFKGVAETLHVYEVERIGMYPRPVLPARDASRRRRRPTSPRSRSSTS